MVLVHTTRNYLLASYLHSMLRGAGVDAELVTAGRHLLLEIFVPDEQAVSAGEMVKTLIEERKAIAARAAESG